MTVLVPNTIYILVNKKKEMNQFNTLLSKMKSVSLEV